MRRVAGDERHGDGAARAPLALFGLAFAAIATAFTLSSFALVQLGINYSETGGSLLTKIHPATYLATAAVAVRLALDERPSRFLGKVALNHGGAAVFAWLVVTLIAYSAANLHLPLTLFVDTFIFPIFMLILIDGIDETSARRIGWLIHLIFAVNAVLALFEMATGWRLTHLVVQGIDLSSIEHRSSALFGHPLGNAMFTGLYAVVLAVGGDRDLPGWMKPAALLLQITAMFTFGGRLATVTMFALLAALALRQIGGLLQGRRFEVRSAALWLATLPLLIGAVVVAYDAGFFDILLDRFVEDQGSAQARVIMFELFSHFTPFELLFGVDQQKLHSLMWTEGIEFGVESFWVSFVLNYGAVPSLLFFMGLGAFLLDLGRSAGKGVAWVILFFLVVISGSLSIGDKTLALGAMVIAVMILLRPPEAQRARFAWPRVARPAGAAAVPAV